MYLLHILNGLKVKRLTVKFSVDEKIHFSAVFGAYLRNGFMFFARHVQTEDGRSLRDVIDTVPIGKESPLYRQLSGGFPKGFFFDISSNDALYTKRRDYYLHPGVEHSFDLVLVGRMAEYESYFIDALQMLFDRGMGNPMGRLCIKNIIGEDVVFSGVNGYQQDGTLEMRIDFITPVCLVKNMGAKSRNSFQDKMNGFPSFYQFVRSVLYRLYTLDVLYGEGIGPTDADINANDILDEYIAPAGDAVMTSATLNKTVLYNTPKKDTSRIIEFAGYSGTMEFENVHALYHPILKFAENFNVGNDIVYGLGAFRVNII